MLSTSTTSKQGHQETHHEQLRQKEEDLAYPQVGLEAQEIQGHSLWPDVRL
jgi:hypothetical protein